jgi:Protein of unknown function (DUF2905)
MLRWLIVFFIALLIFQGAARRLRKFGLGRLPGDFHVRVGGRELFVPLASSVVLSAIIAGISLWF